MHFDLSPTEDDEDFFQVKKSTSNQVLNFDDALERFQIDSFSQSPREKKFETEKQFNHQLTQNQDFFNDNFKGKIHQNILNFQENKQEIFPTETLPSNKPPNVDAWGSSGFDSPEPFLENESFQNVKQNEKQVEEMEEKKNSEIFGTKETEINSTDVLKEDFKTDLKEEKEVKTPSMNEEFNEVKSEKDTSFDGQVQNEENKTEDSNSSSVEEVNESSSKIQNEDFGKFNETQEIKKTSEIQQVSVLNENFVSENPIEEDFGDFEEFNKSQKDEIQKNSETQQEPPKEKLVSNIQIEEDFGELNETQEIKNTQNSTLDFQQSPSPKGEKLNEWSDKPVVENLANPQQTVTIEEEEFGEFENVHKETQKNSLEETKKDDFEDFTTNDDDDFGDFNGDNEDDFEDFQATSHEEDFGDFEEPKDNEDFGTFQTSFDEFEEPTDEDFGSFQTVEIKQVLSPIQEKVEVPNFLEVLCFCVNSLDFGKQFRTRNCFVH
jgi:hypothetical protein